MKGDNGRRVAIPDSAAQPRPREVWCCKVLGDWASEGAQGAPTAAGDEGEVPAGVVDDDDAPGNDDVMLFCISLLSISVLFETRMV